MIFCDSREDPVIIDTLSKFTDAYSLYLPCDYCLYGRYADLNMVEHMTSSGFLGDIESGRLDYEKIPKMLAEKPTSITLLIEGNPECSNGGYAKVDNRDTGWTLKSIYGYRFYYQDIFNISIEWVADKEALVYWLLEKYKWINEPHEYKLPKRQIPTTFDSKKNRYLYFLTGIKRDNVSAVDIGRASAILRYASDNHDCLSTITSWSEETWSEVQGIGKKLAHEIFTFLHEPVSIENTQQSKFAARKVGG